MGCIMEIPTNIRNHFDLFKGSFAELLAGGCVFLKQIFNDFKLTCLILKSSLIFFHEQHIVLFNLNH